MTQSETAVRLDLGSGERCREGFEGVDFFAPSAQHQVNLMKFPWPWADSSVDEIYCSHFLEHLPMVFVGPDNDYCACPETPQHRDLLFRFMDECWRILKPGAPMLVVVPSGRSNRGFQDPTHRRFFVADTFTYFNAEWRGVNGIHHYLGACNFTMEVKNRVASDFSNLPLDVQQYRADRHWNAVQDFVAFMVAVK